MEESDLELKCADCSKTFVFSTGERAFLEKLKADGKISNVSEPKRCKECKKNFKDGRIVQAHQYRPRHQFDGDEELIGSLNK